MDKNKTLKLVGVGILLAIAFVFLVIGVLNFPCLTEKMFGQLADTKEKLTLAQIVVSLVGFIFTIVAFGFAIYQYRKSARWKRMEFIANEVKEFEADPVVQNALLMIDWGTRKINLNLVSNSAEEDFKLITREVQWKALLPHPLKQEHEEYQAAKCSNKAESESTNSKAASSESIEKTNSKNQKELNFTVDEAKIRDTYDVFLTRLDRFATFIKANLIEPNELRPFIDYWIDALTNTEGLDKDAAWKCTLLTYINYYKYSGVKELFKDFGKDLNPEGEVYQAVMNRVQDKLLAERLHKSISSSK